MYAPAESLRSVFHSSLVLPLAPDLTYMYLSHCNDEK